MLYFGNVKYNLCIFKELAEEALALIYLVVFLQLLDFLRTGQGYRREGTQARKYIIKDNI